MGRKWNDKADNRSSSLLTEKECIQHMLKYSDIYWKAKGNATEETFHTSNLLPWQSAQPVCMFRLLSLGKSIV